MKVLEGKAIQMFHLLPKVDWVVDFGFLGVTMERIWEAEKFEAVDENLRSFFLTLAAKWPSYAFSLCFHCLSGLN